MNRFLAFTKRNILLYTKNKTQIFFSLLTSLITIVLYIFFLKNTYIQPLIKFIMENNIAIKIGDLSLLTDMSIIASSVCLATITIPFTLLQTIVFDKDKGIDCDILASPLRRNHIILSYLFAAFLVSFIASSFLTIIGFTYLFINASNIINIIDIIKVIGCNFLACLSATSFLTIVIIFFEKSESLSGFYALFSAIIGFVVGAYVPLSAMPKKIAQVLTILPHTQLNILYKRFFTRGLLDKIEMSKGIYVKSFMENYKLNTGINIKFINFANSSIIIYSLILIVICFILVTFIYARKYKKH